jgi:DNA-binding transcriptional ArsR family regulator
MNIIVMIIPWTVAYVNVNCVYLKKSVNEIVVLTNCSQSLVSHQLKILKDTKLVVSRKEGTKVFYSLADGHIKVLLKVIREHIEEENHND